MLTPSTPRRRKSKPMTPTHQTTASEDLAHEATATAREKRMPLVGRMSFQLGGAMLLGVVAAPDAAVAK